MMPLYYKRLDRQSNTNERGPNLSSCWTNKKVPWYHTSLSRRLLFYHLLECHLHISTIWTFKFAQLPPCSVCFITTWHRVSSSAQLPSCPAHGERRRRTGLQRTCQGSHVFQNLESIQGEVGATCYRKTRRWSWFWWSWLLYAFSVQKWSSFEVPAMSVEIS